MDPFGVWIVACCSAELLRLGPHPVIVHYRHYNPLWSQLLTGGLTLCTVALPFCCIVTIYHYLSCISKWMVIAACKLRCKLALGWAVPFFVCLAEDLFSSCMPQVRIAEPL